jgi:hypothetical protein
MTVCYKSVPGKMKWKPAGVLFWDGCYLLSPKKSAAGANSNMLADAI